MNFGSSDFLEKCKSFFITTCGRDICCQKNFAEGKLSKFMPTTDTHLIPSDLALAIWSLTMPVNEQTLSRCSVARLQSHTSARRQGRLDSLT